MPTTTPGVYTMSISIAYKDQTSNANGLSLSSGYLINGDINLISTVDSQDTITPNSRGTATIKISNAGQDIKFLTLKIATTKEFKKIVPETIYIGNLKSDNYDTEKLTIYTTNIEPKIYPLNATLEYQDVFGKKYSENREFSILVSEPISQTNPVFVLGILVLVAIVIYAGYRIFYRKKK